MSADVTDKHLCNISMDIENYNVHVNTKVATVTPIYKKKSRNELENYRPVSLLNAFSKIYERCIHNSIAPFVSHFLSIFISAYRKTYRSNHVLWKQSLDNRKYVGAVLMDFRKTLIVFPTIF